MTNSAMRVSAGLHKVAASVVVCPWRISSPSSVTSLVDILAVCGFGGFGGSRGGRRVNRGSDLRVKVKAEPERDR